MNRDRYFNTAPLLGMRSDKDEVTQELETLFAYHLSENHLASSRSIILQQLALLSLALVGLLYATPAAENAKTETEAILNIIGTCFTACIVPCAATISFYNMHVAPQYVPDELKDILSPPLTPEEYLRQNIIIGFFSLLSAVPFATVTFAFKLPIDFSLFIVFIAYVLIANTLLHFLPVKLTLQHPVYGALPRFFHNTALYFMGHKLSEVDILALAKKNERNQSVSAAISILKNAKAHFLSSLIDDLDTAKDKLTAHQSIDSLLSEILSCYKDSPTLSDQAIISARVMGVVIVCLSCLGYLANPYLVFRDKFHFSPWAAALCTTPPMYFFGILLAFFGDTFGQRLLADIALQGPSVIKLSVIAKLYPKMITLLSAINLSLVYFSAAAAKEMMRIAFEKILPVWAMTALYVVAHLGIGLIAWYTPLDYEKILLSYCAQYGHEEPHKSIMVFKAQFEALLHDLNRLKPEFSNALIEYVNSRIKIAATDPKSLHSTSIWSCKNACPCFYKKEECRNSENVALLSIDSEICATVQAKYTV